MTTTPYSITDYDLQELEEMLLEDNDFQEIQGILEQMEYERGIL